MNTTIARHIHLPRQQYVLPRLRHRPIIGRYHQYRPVHLRRPCYHVLYVVRMPRTIYVRIMTIIRLILDVRYLDRQPPLLLLRRIVYLIILDVLHLTPSSCSIPSLSPTSTSSSHDRHARSSLRLSVASSSQTLPSPFCYLLLLLYKNIIQALLLKEQCYPQMIFTRSHIAFLKTPTLWQEIIPRPAHYLFHDSRRSRLHTDKIPSRTVPLPWVKGPRDRGISEHFSKRDGGFEDTRSFSHVHFHDLPPPCHGYHSRSLPQILIRGKDNLNVIMGSRSTGLAFCSGLLESQGKPAILNAIGEESSS